jgi:hypothetical protein
MKRRKIQYSQSDVGFRYSKENEMDFECSSTTNFVDDTNELRHKISLCKIKSNENLSFQPITMTSIELCFRERSEQIQVNSKHVFFISYSFLSLY